MHRSAVADDAGIRDPDQVLHRGDTRSLIDPFEGFRQPTRSYTIYRYAESVMELRGS